MVNKLELCFIISKSHSFTMVSLSSALDSFIVKALRLISAWTDVLFFFTLGSGHKWKSYAADVTRADRD